MIWRLKRRTFDLTHRGVIMGVLNVTPDSFSDGGEFLDPAQAVTHALRMEGEGAEIIDVGGESTDPEPRRWTPEEELRRVVPVIRALRARSDVVISIDTSKAVVAQEAVSGADIINDVTASARRFAHARSGGEFRSGSRARCICKASLGRCNKILTTTTWSPNC